MTTSTCPNCGAAATGNFCSSCGAPIADPTCPTCHTQLARGAKFCHKCGAPAAARPGAVSSPERPQAGPAAIFAGSARMPWLVTGVFGVVAVAAVLYATRGHADSTASGTAAPPAGATGQPPDLSTMTPREQFTRLSDRVTAAAERRDTATVTMFWPMLMGAYQNLPTGGRDADARFHMGWLYLQTGQAKQAAALADSILTAAPNHLLGYYLRATVAVSRGDSTQARAARAAFHSHYDAEMKRTDRPEYTDHRALLDQFQKNGAVAP